MATCLRGQLREGGTPTTAGTEVDAVDDKEQDQDPR